MYRPLNFCLAIATAIAILVMGNFAIARNLADDLTVLQFKSPILLAATKGRTGGGSLGYSCEGLQCTCQGDVDCNDMFGSGKCGDIASCDSDTGICKCLMLKKNPVKKPPIGKVPTLKVQ